MYCLSWNSYKNNICNGFAQLQQKEEFVDMTIVAEGHLVKVHKNLISLASPYIKNVIKAVSCPHPIIFLTNIRHDVLCHLLEYIYTGEVHVEMEKLNDFIKAAKELQLPGIANDLSPAIKTNAQGDNAAESLPIEEQFHIQKRPFEFRPSDAPMGSNIDNIFHINIPPSQNTNNNDLPLGESLSSGNLNNASEAFGTNKIQILENRRLECGTTISDAAIESNANNNVLNIDMDISDNPSNNHSLPLSITSLVNGQNTNTSETLPIVTDIQLFGNGLHDFATSEAAVSTNDMNNLLDTNITSRNDDSNHYDYSHSVTVTHMEDADDFGEFLKFPDPPNSTVEGNNSVTSEQTQKLKVMDPDNKEVQHEFSLALGPDILPQQYTVSNRGSVQMVLNRYLYSMHHSANGGAKRRWRCIDYRYLRCGAYIDTLDDKIIKRKNIHAHPFHDSKILKKIQDNLVFGTLCAALDNSKKMSNMAEPLEFTDST